MNKQTAKILIVDDFSTMRRIVKTLLIEIGYQGGLMSEAEDGEIALQKIKKEKFDLIVTDWNMPNMTGLELLKHIRSMPESKDIPVLMVTAEAKREQIIEAAQNGVSGYIIKPFTAATLEEKLQKIIERFTK